MTSSPSAWANGGLDDTLPPLVAALRDMRHANGRDPTTGQGVGNRSWIGLSIAMIVLDTLTREDEGVADRWKHLLTAHEVSEEDADLIYALRNSLLHGYGVPKPSRTHGRTVLLHQRPFPVRRRYLQGRPGAGERAGVLRAPGRAHRYGSV